MAFRPWCVLWALIPPALSTHFLRYPGGDIGSKGSSSQRRKCFSPSYIGRVGLIGGILRKKIVAPPLDLSSVKISILSVELDVRIRCRLQVTLYNNTTAAGFAADRATQHPRDREIAIVPTTSRGRARPCAVSREISF